MKHPFVFALLVFVSALTTPRVAAASEEATAGRALVKRYADAIVGVELVVTIKLRVGDREAPPREQRLEVNATVISSSGLAVTSLADVDPQVAFDSVRSSQGGRGPELVGTDFKEVKFRLADGREVPARFVLKDADLDLAFIAPEAKDAKDYPFVSLDEATEGAALDRFFYLARAPKNLQRVPLIRSTFISGVVERPRRFYIMTEVSPGTPVLDAAGKVLGITLQNFANGRRSGYVVLPSADIAEMAKQATAAAAK